MLNYIMSQQILFIMLIILMCLVYFIIKNKFVAQMVRIFESHDIYSDSLTLVRF